MTAVSYLVVISVFSAAIAVIGILLNTWFSKHYSVQVPHSAQEVQKKGSTELSLPNEAPKSRMELIIETVRGTNFNHVIEKSITTIGREVDNDVVLKEFMVSRHHCKIRWNEDKYWLYDLKSSNGTFVNNRRIADDGVELGDGDLISLGDTKITVKIVNFRPI